LYSRNIGNNNFINTTSYENKDTTYYIKNINPTLNTEATVQADYQTPVKDNQMFEIGAKEIMRHATSNATYQQAFTDGFTHRIQEYLQVKFIDYTQNITAGYLLYTLTTPSKYSFKAGTRYEYTIVDAQTSQDHSQVLTE